MEGTLKIEFNWKSNDSIEIPEGHKEALIDDAYDRIFNQIKEGYFMGELNTSVRFGSDVVPEEDEEEGLSYSGWWSVKIETK
jgi:hypothetical protein